MTGLRLALLAAALILVGWVRLLPLEIDGIEPAAQAAVRQRAAALAGGGDAAAAWMESHRDEVEMMLAEERRRRRDFLSLDDRASGTFPYIGGFDSYVWLRAARNSLRHGSPCDSVVNGECRDDFTLAPVGTRSRYASSLHVSALAGFHRVLSRFDGALPLEVSAFLLSYVVALLGVFPAFWLGARFGGAVGGFLAAVLVSFNTTFLYRSFGVDNDVWNVVLPLFEVWAIIEAMYAERTRTRILFVTLAAVVTGLHAAIWKGWILTSGVVVLGLSANALLWAVRRLVHGEPAGEASEGFARAVSLAGGYVVAATAASWVAGAQASPLSSAADILGQVIGGGGDTAVSLRWPSVFRTVGELRQPNLAGLAQGMAGPVYFFVAWLGLILLMLPRSGWHSWHFAILVGGNLLYRYLLTYTAIDPWTLATLLVLPLAIAVGAYLADGESPVEDQGAGAMLILWFLAGLLMSFRGNRFLILLAPPLGVLCAVAAGRLQQWVERQSWASPPVRALVAAALLATAYPPIARGERAARSYLPLMNDAWHGALVTLRDETPDDAVVNTWWDYGYFVKYVAERRALSDGGTLGTHVHYWFARAMIAGSETETVGLLRMLNCGSDALPEPEGRHGAFAALLDAGVAPGAAVDAIIAMASMDRDAAKAHLHAMGIERDRRREILERTHCDPAPAYLVLPGDFPRSIGWRWLGRWSFLDATAAALRDDPAAAARLVELFGVEPAAAAAALRQNDAGGSLPRAPQYVAPQWFACEGSGELRCAVDVRLANGDLLRAVVVPTGDPAATRLVVRGRDGVERERAPGAVLSAAPDQMVEIAAADEEPSVLVDLDQQRVLIGSAVVLRSTVTRLMFLDQGDLRRFLLFDRQAGINGEVATWRIVW